MNNFFVIRTNGQSYGQMCADICMQDHSGDEVSRDRKITDIDNMMSIT